jgi:hypothetical protein
MRVARLPARPLSAVAIVMLMAVVAAACSRGALVAGPGDRAMAVVSTGPSPTPSLDPPIDPDIGINNITHVIVIVQENRSFDHYFGAFPGADGLPRDASGHIAVCVPDPEAGHCQRPYHDTNLFDAGGPHGLVGSDISQDGGRMDGYVRALEQIGNGCEHRPATSRAGRPARAGGTARRHGVPHRPRRSRTTGRTRSTSSCRTTCSRRSRRGRCPRICSWCRHGPRRARISGDP